MAHVDEWELDDYVTRVHMVDNGGVYQSSTLGEDHRHQCHEILRATKALSIQK